MVSSAKSTPATTIELKKVEKNLRQEILRVDKRLEGVEDRLEGVENRLVRVEEKVDGIEKKIDKLTNIAIDFVGRVDSLETENTVGANQIHDLIIDVISHERRSTQLETVTHIS